MIAETRDFLARQLARLKHGRASGNLDPEMADQALDRPGRRVAERADGVAFDLLGDVEQHVDLLFSASPFTMRSITRHIQPVPSRHGVHWPQLSCL
jgi:hypothetical protein